MNIPTRADHPLNPHKVWALTPEDVSFKPKVEGDVGHDLYVRISPEHQTFLDRVVSWMMGRPVMVVMPVVGQRVLSCGVQISMPPDVWCEVRARSSTSKKRLQILGGTIDSGYTGELFTVLHNFGLHPRLIENGERYAQVVFYNAVRPMIRGVNEDTFVKLTADKTRGSAGFGSTGL